MTDEPRVSARELIPAPEPDYAVPPGESLRERLTELHMSQAEFARRTGLTTKHVNQVMQGVASLSAEVAQRLEYATGTPSWWWLRLEADYRDALTRLSQREELAGDVAWVDSMPVRELLRQGVLPDEPKDKVAGSSNSWLFSASPAWTPTRRCGEPRRQPFASPRRTR